MGAIIDFFSSIVGLLVNLVKSILWFVTSLPSMLSTLETAVGFAPSFILPFLLLALSATALVAIIRLI